VEGRKRRKRKMIKMVLMERKSKLRNPEE